jgi:predicted lipoprotein with Yx(FWY)xxD motif
MKAAIFSAILLSLPALVGCGSSTGSYGSASSSSGSGSRNSSGISVLNGHLVDASGFSLYTTTGSCSGGCLTVWPPDEATSPPTASDGANSGLIGLSSGQVTYNGSLLYYFESDTSAGQTNGSGVGGFVLATP